MKLKGTLREQLEALDQRETELLGDIDALTRELLFYKNKDQQQQLDVRANHDRPSSKQQHQKQRKHSSDDTDTTTMSETSGRNSRVSQSNRRPSSKDQRTDDKKKIEVCYCF